MEENYSLGGYNVKNTSIYFLRKKYIQNPNPSPHKKVIL